MAIRKSRKKLLHKKPSAKQAIAAAQHQASAEPQPQQTKKQPPAKYQGTETARPYSNRNAHAKKTAAPH
jgi:hypothetical protein